MRGNDLATRVLQAVDGNPEAIKQISDALASGDPTAIQAALSTYAGMEISTEEAQEIAETIKASPSQPAAYQT
jgi:hypothetical protein